MQRNDHLRDINFSNNDNSVNDNVLEVIAQCLPQLTNLNICSCTLVTDAGIAVLTESCRRITELNVAHLSQLTILSCKYIVSRLSQLRKITFLRSRAAYKDEMTVYADHFQSVTSYLIWTDITLCGEPKSEEEKNAPKPRLHTLIDRTIGKLSANYRYNAAEGRMFRRSPQMKEFRTSFASTDEMTCFGQTFYSKIVLYNKAKYFTCLRELTLRCTGQWSIHDSSLLAVLRCNAQLQILCVANCQNLSDSLVMSVAEHCVHLKHLNVRFCPLVSDESILEIAAKCVGLNYLNVGCCTRVTSMSIKAVIVKCTFLTTLLANGCPVENELRLEIEENYGIK